MLVPFSAEQIAGSAIWGNDNPSVLQGKDDLASCYGKIQGLGPKQTIGVVLVITVMREKLVLNYQCCTRIDHHYSVFCKT